MTIKIGGHTFNGPYASTNPIEDRSGVYVVLCKKDNKYQIIDVGESSEVKSRLDKHGRKKCWVKECKETLTYTVKYTPHLKQKGRMEIEQKIRDKLKIPCGET